ATSESTTAAPRQRDACAEVVLLRHIGGTDREDDARVGDEHRFAVAGVRDVRETARAFLDELRVTRAERWQPVHVANAGGRRRSSALTRLPPGGPAPSAPGPTTACIVAGARRVNRLEVDETRADRIPLQIALTRVGTRGLLATGTRARVVRITAAATAGF